jgi:hypothetical protein
MRTPVAIAIINCLVLFHHITPRGPNGKTANGCDRLAISRLETGIVTVLAIHAVPADAV